MVSGGCRSEIKSYVGIRITKDFNIVDIYGGALIKREVAPTNYDFTGNPSIM